MVFHLSNTLLDTINAKTHRDCSSSGAPYYKTPGIVYLLFSLSFANILFLTNFLLFFPLNFDSNM